MKMADPWIDVPHRPVQLGPTECLIERRSDGSIRMRLAEPLQDYPRRYTERLVHWATTAPERVFMARRPPGGPKAGAWETLSYGATHDKVRAMGQALLERGLGADRPVMILSENDFDNQLLALACTHVGIPYVPVSPAYALLSQDHARLKLLNGLVQPGLVYASSSRIYGPAARAAFPEVEFVASSMAARRRPSTPCLRSGPAPRWMPPMTRSGPSTWPSCSSPQGPRALPRA